MKFAYGNSKNYFVNKRNTNINSVDVGQMKDMKKATAENQRAHFKFGYGEVSRPLTSVNVNAIKQNENNKLPLTRSNPYAKYVSRTVNVTKTEVY